MILSSYFRVGSDPCLRSDPYAAKRLGLGVPACGRRLQPIVGFRLVCQLVPKERFEGVEFSRLDDNPQIVWDCRHSDRTIKRWDLNYSDLPLHSMLWAGIENAKKFQSRPDDHATCFCSVATEIEQENGRSA